MDDERTYLLSLRSNINDRLQRIAMSEDEHAPHKGIDVDHMTPDLWRSMSADERQAWTNWWRTQGMTWSLPNDLDKSQK